VFIGAVGDFLRAWPRLLATDVVYKIIAFVVLAPMAGLALQFFMSTSGSSVLADQDILFFALSPVGLAALVLFEGVGAAQPLTTSAARTEGHKWIVGITLVAWGAVAALLSALPLAVVGTLGRWMMPKFAGSMTMLVIVMGGFLLLWGLLNLLVTLVNSAMFALLTVRLYGKLGSSPDAQLSSKAISEKLATSDRRRMSMKWALTGLAVAAILAAVTGYLFLDNVRLEDDVIVIAHRGAAGSAPENTLASVELAVDQGADIVEIDVQETADGEVVVVHDSDLMRVGGAAVKIWEATCDELMQIDVGSWYGPEFSGQRVPTLEQVLEICKGRSRVNIELKYYGHNERLEERVAEIVERMGMEDEVVLMSLAYDIVLSMKALLPEWTVGLLTAKAMGDLTTSEADFLAVHVGIAGSRFVRRAHAAGKEVYV